MYSWYPVTITKLWLCRPHKEIPSSYSNPLSLPILPSKPYILPPRPPPPKSFPVSRRKKSINAISSTANFDQVSLVQLHAIGTALSRRLEICIYLAEMFIKTEGYTLLSHLKTYQKLSHTQWLFLLKWCGNLLFLTEEQK